MCLAALLLTAGVANAVVWNPTDPNTIATGYGDWNNGVNWVGGIVPTLASGNTSQGTATYAVANPPECWITGAADCYKFAMGDNGPATPPSQNAVVRVKDGGVLTIGPGNSWAAFGYNRDGGTVIVEKGGQMFINAHLWFGATAGGVGNLVMNGGYFKVKDAFDLGRSDTSYGYVTLNDGLLRIRYFPDAADTPGSLMDIRFGTFATENNYLARPSNLWSRIDAGTIKAFGGKGALVVTREPLDGTTLTCVRAIHPMVPVPAYKSTVAEGSVDLSWTNMDPNKPGDPVYVDVWFGTDPNKLSLAYSEVVAAGMNTTTVNVSAPVIGTPPTTYYWQVDSYIYGSPAGTPIEGDVFQFDVTNDFAPTVVIDTPNTVTWNGQPVQMNATVSDTGSSALTIAWSANNPNAVFSDASVEDPVVTISNLTTFPTTVVLTCSVKDALNPQTNTATRNVVVYADACLAARAGAGLAAAYRMDLAEPYCVIDMADLAVIAADWLVDYTLTSPMVIP